MQVPKSLPHRKPAAGFTLPAILVVVSALLILTVGILLVVGIERNTAHSFADRERANLAVRAGLEDIRGVFTQEAANDDFMILQSSLAKPITPGRDPAPQLFLARGKAAGTGYSYRYVPLFSTLAQPASSPTLASPPVEPLVGANDREWFDFTTLPYQDKVRAAWLPVLDEKGRTVARYAFWVEDMQGKLDPKIAGNLDGAAQTHLREPYPFPAPGLDDPATGSANQTALNQVALYAVDSAATEDQQGTAGISLIKNRAILISPDSSLAAAGILAPIHRDAAGHQTDLTARAIEENLAPGLRSYLEQPLVPFATGIDPSAAGKPKLNLNKLLATSGDAAVSGMADFIKNALPKFEDRKGGFPDDYLKTLAANAIDYADKDREPTQSAGKYRGLDAYPLVSEFLLKVHWENIRTASGRKYLELSVSTYVELWNMTNQPIEGAMELTYETKYGFQIPPNPNLFRLNDLSHATGHGLNQIDGNWWYPAIGVKLNPNEYHVYKCGTVRFSIDAASTSEFIPSPLTLSGETYGASGAGYKMRWNGQLVDQSRGAMHRNDAAVNYPSDTKDKPRQRLRATIPSHSHSRGTFINNMGDPRMSFYNLSPQDANIYPQNFSPNRRNIRTGSAYGSSNVNAIYGRVLPSEWPDGGHDSPFGTDSVCSLLGITQSAFNDDQRVDPDDSRFYGSPPYDYSASADMALAEMEAPQRISNQGRFYSATELGRVYDPVMWMVRSTSDTSTTAGKSWGDVTVSSQSNTDYGGGNTLRIGRPEHQKFDQDPQTRASRLLDLFHAGQALSDDRSLREGNTVEIKGQVNINTIGKPALRSMLAGKLTQDPEIRRFDSNSHVQGTRKYPDCSPVSPGPDPLEIADRAADAIIRSRPLATTADLAAVREPDGTPIFGNPMLFSQFRNIGYPIMQWTDSAAEETFARVFESTTVRSRNFRVWIVGQALAPAASGNASREVLSEVRRCYSVFVDPGDRKADGSIDPAKLKMKPTHENDF